jgi:Flp pilus assembly protein TadB
MLRFLAGILMVQAASVALVLVAGIDLRNVSSWLPIALALGIIGLVAAFWFATVAAHMRRDESERLRASFAREREDLKVKAEREKTRLVRKNSKTLASETRRAESRANRKVAVAVGAASSVGLLMMLTSFMTLGLLVLTGAGSALGGYLAGRNWLPGRLFSSSRKTPIEPLRQRLKAPSSQGPK